MSDVITVESLTLGKDITILTDSEEIIASSTYVAQEAEEEAKETESEPEVLEKVSKLKKRLQKKSKKVRFRLFVNLTIKLNQAVNGLVFCY